MINRARIRGINLGVLMPCRGNPDHQSLPAKRKIMERVIISWYRRIRKKKKVLQHQWLKKKPRRRKRTKIRSIRKLRSKRRLSRRSIRKS